MQEANQSVVPSVCTVIWVETSERSGPCSTSKKTLRVWDDPAEGQRGVLSCPQLEAQVPVPAPPSAAVGP